MVQTSDKDSPVSFDPKAALKELNGQTLDAEEMYRRFKKIRGDHFRDLPIEFTVNDLFALAQRNKWVREETNGRLRIDVQP
jgi:hypothetical protein